MSEKTMENGRPGRKSGRKPWRLLVPNYRKSEHQQSCVVDQRANVDLSNHEPLLLESKGDPSWHCTRIPLERRMVLQLPVLSWSSERERPKVKEFCVIELEDESRAYEPAGKTIHLEATPRLIPLERRKRKRSDTESPNVPREIDSERMKNGASPTVGKKISECAPILASMLSKLPSTSCGIEETEPTRKEALLRTPQKMSCLENSSTSTVSLKNCSQTNARLSSAERPESPPMRILSVRSLADDSSYYFDMLEERIPVDATNEAGDDKPPLYIFNPVRLYSDSVHGKAQNDSPLLETSETPKETTSDTQGKINESRNSAAEINASIPVAPAPHNSENVRSHETGAAVSRSSFSDDGSGFSNAQEKVAREIKRETESRATTPIAEDTACALDGARTGAISARSSSSKVLSGSDARSGARNSTLEVSKARKKERLDCTTCVDDLRFVLDFERNSSPFEDSDEADEDTIPLRPTNEPSRPSFLSDVLKELDVNNSETSADPQNLTLLDHCYSRPTGENFPLDAGEVATDFDETSVQQALTAENDQSINGLARLVLRLPKSVNEGHSSSFLHTSLPRRRQRKNSSSSSTDTSVGVATKTSLQSTSGSIEQELSSKRRRTRSEMILRKMQIISQKDASQFSAEVTEREKLAFLEELAHYFSENDFSREPLNRSILNAMADWLSPLPNGKLPSAKVRNELVDLIKRFTLTTPAQVFQTSSIEGVLILLMNHPKESLRNKRLEWYIVNSWRDD